MARVSRGIALAVLVLATVAPLTHAHAVDVGAACTATDWPRLNAPALRPAWVFNTSSPVTAQPAVVDGVLYVGAFDGKFYALNAIDGSEKWTYDVTPHDTEKTDYGKIPNSAAVATIGSNKQVVIFGGGETLFVLDASNGALLAKQCLDRVDPTCKPPAGTSTTSEIESSPVVFTDGLDGLHIVVGTDVNEADHSGPVGLYSLHLSSNGTLSPDWYFNPETGDTATGADALASATTSGHGCGDVWSSPSVDLGTRSVVFGTGNCNHPTEVGPHRVKLTESTIALNLDSGAMRWQAAPYDEANGLDVDFGATPNMLDPGHVGEGGKDGNYYVYPLDGPPGWKVQVATGSSIGGMIASTAVGYVSNGHQAVFAASAIPVSPNNMQGSITNDVQHPNQAFSVHAVDTVTHAVLWDTPTGPAFAAPVFANGVVFVPDTTNDALLAIDADTGVVLHAQPVNAPPSSPVAVVGRSVYMGCGTTQNSPPLSAISALGGIWSFTTDA
jgi:outer membrane protein assembly factor BamB